MGIFIILRGRATKEKASEKEKLKWFMSEQHPKISKLSKYAYSFYCIRMSSTQQGVACFASLRYHRHIKNGPRSCCHSPLILVTPAQCGKAGVLVEKEIECLQKASWKIWLLATATSHLQMQGRVWDISRAREMRWQLFIWDSWRSKKRF